MIRIAKTEPDDDAWRGIKRRADEGCEALKRQFQSGQKPEVDDSLYKEYMPFLKEAFASKCAYCETTLAGQPGDVEHFRPKNRVSGLDFRPIKFTDPVTGQDVPHPGYFWLAYEWSNLLPSCIGCNRFRWYHQPKQVGAGKADRFPVRGQHRPDWSSNIVEEPLLLDPADPAIDPDQHLRIKLDEQGRPYLEALTEEGECTRDVFGLNTREDLLGRRAAAYAEAREALESYMIALVQRHPAIMVRRDRVNRFWRGHEPYTMVHRFAFLEAQSFYAANGIVLSLPLT